MVRPRASRALQFLRAWLPGAAHRRFALRPPALRLARPARVRQHSALHRGDVRSRIAQPHRRSLRRSRRLLQLLASAPAVPNDRLGAPPPDPVTNALQPPARRRLLSSNPDAREEEPLARSR